MAQVSREEIEIAVTYLVKRQLQGRPTTMRQLGKRMGIMSGRVLDAIEAQGVLYVLVTHEELAGRVTWGHSNTEVMLQHVPEYYAKIIGVSVDEIEKSFTDIYGEQPKPHPRYKQALANGEPIAESLDPFAGYRIDRDKYEALKVHLITFDELVQVAREKGFSVAAIRRATGGDRMRLPLPSFFWRPYVYGKKRFYLKDVLYHLGESDLTYRSRGKLDGRRKVRFGEPTKKKFIEFGELKVAKSAPRKGKRK
jgi:hypothetical protein